MPDYWWYQQQALGRLGDDRKLGPAYAPFVTVGEHVMKEHVTAYKQEGSPCVACGQPWPCKMFLSITAPD